MTAQGWITLALGLPSLLVAFITWRQRNANDARDQWWKRATWAVDRSLDTDPNTAAVGSAALLAIWEEHAPEGVDRKLLRSFAATILLTDTAGQSHTTEDNEDTREEGDPR